MDHYRNIETHLENTNGDKIISYYLDGDSPTDTCYSLLTVGDDGQQSEISFTRYELSKFENLLNLLDEARGLR